MPTYLSPGVYVEEIPGGARPIEGVATSVTAFVGSTRRGPAGEAVPIQSVQDYLRVFGPIASEQDAMGLAVQAFYLNGGRSAYVCRVVGDAPPAVASSMTVPGRATGSAAVLRISAASVGAWGDELRGRIVKPNTADLTFTLQVGRLQAGAFVADESFTGLSMNVRDANYALTRVNRDSQLVRVSVEPAATNVANLVAASLVGAAVPSAATQFSAAVVDAMSLRLRIDGGSPRTVALGTAASLALTGANQADGDAIALALQGAIRALDAAVPAIANFGVTYAGNRFTLRSGAASTFSDVEVLAGNGTPTDLAALLRIGPANAPTRVQGAANIVPQQVLGLNDAGVAFLGGADSAPSAQHYTNFFDDVLRKVRDVSVLVLPGATWPSRQPIVDAARAHCEAMRSRVLIIDPDASATLDSGQAVEALGLPTSTYTVAYYPWVGMANPFFDADRNPNVAKTIAVAPSSFAAGMWSRIDARRGVWKAPAGVETQLTGVARLEDIVEDGEQEQLNPRGVNAIRKMPGFGPVIWGARTLATNADPEWRYVPVRRTAIYIEQSIYNGIQWAVFEPNDHPLWSALRANIGSFMNGLFRAGAFQGATANDAYFVRCGLGDTMTQGDIDRGQVIAVVGFAPLKPAEFVIIRIQQKVQQQ